MAVLILVFVEDNRRLIFGQSQRLTNPTVLILVFVEDNRRREDAFDNKTFFFVLILVFVEDNRRRVKFRSGSQILNGLNPCFCGR